MSVRKDIVPQDHHLSLLDRERISGHRSAVLWFTGLPSSGKTTLSFELEKELFQKGCQSFALDGDNLRQGLCNDLGFSREDRRENIRRIGELSVLFMNAGFLVLVACVSPYQEDRDDVRALVPEGRFFEVFVDCPLDECRRRDPKGHYRKAEEGQIKSFTGITNPYEVPIHPEIHIPTNRLSLQESIKIIFQYLEEKQVISSGH